MENRAALPRRVKHSDKLDLLIRLRRDFAVIPYGADSKKWQSGAVRRRKAESDQEEHKRLIREADSSIKGINFPAEEMAKIIRSWMRQDDM
jgi:hypothetical protein